MAMFIDDYLSSKSLVDGKWVIAKPVNDVFIVRLRDAFKVVSGEYQAVKFHNKEIRKTNRKKPCDDSFEYALINCDFGEEETK